MKTYQNIRRPYAAGTFYPGTAEELRRMVNGLLAGAPVPPQAGELFAIMAPHAGYVYSARVAAPAYRALEQADFDTIVIIGHDFGPQAGDILAVVDDHEAFGTPLGPVEVDLPLLRALCRELPQVIVHNGVHSREHSVEIHLPFLKTLKPEAKILPVLFGEATPAHCRAFADALERVAGDTRLLILASTDLSHYPAYNDAKILDLETTSYVENMDLAGLCARQAGRGVDAPNVETPICSAGGVGVAMEWSRRHGVYHAEILARANSGDAGGGCNQVVGYASARFALPLPSQGTQHA